jgi:3'(2'), 5'-bisphosphate nucleotidase
MKHETIIALDIARRAAKEIMAIYQSEFSVETKQDGSPVTKADKKANELICNALVDCFPDDAIISEEGDPLPGGRTWYIDPVDGTSSFTKRTDQFAIHIGLSLDGCADFGLIYRPTTGQAYVGYGNIAYRLETDGQETPLRVPAWNPKELVIALSPDFDKALKRKSMYDTMGVTSIFFHGGAGLRIMKIVEGLADFRISGPKNNTWDVCAPEAIFRAAGGYVRGLDDRVLRYERQSGVGMEIVMAKGEEVYEMVRKGCEASQRM